MKYYHKYLIRFFVLYAIYFIFAIALLFLYSSVWSFVICCLMLLLFRILLTVLADNIFFGILVNELDAKKFYNTIYEKLTRSTKRYRLCAEFYVGNYRTVIAMAINGFSNTKSFGRKCKYLVHLANSYFGLGDYENLVKTVETFYQLQKESCFKKYILPRYYVFEYYKAFINKEYEQCICLTETYMKKIRKNSVNGKLQWLVAQKNLAIAYYEIGNIDKSKEIFRWFVENTPKLDAFYNTSVKYLESIESGSSIKFDSIILDEKEMVKYESEFRSAEKKERMKKVVALIFCLFAIIMYIVSGYIRHTKEKYEAQLDAAVTEKYNNGRKLLFFNIEKDDKKVISVCLIEDDYNLILAEIVSDDNGQTLDALEITENIDFNTLYDKKTVSGYYIGFTVLSDKPSGKILDYSLEFEFIDNTYWLYIDYVEKEPRS